MAPKTASSRSIHLPISAFSGFYARVADRLNVDPSYVIRVALGQLQSEEILQAMEREMREITDNLKAKHDRSNRHGAHRNRDNRSGADSDMNEDRQILIE